MKASSSKKKILVGLSGGIDSSVALALLKESGWDPVGVSLKYAVWEDPENRLRENVCCSAESFDIASAVCERMGVPHEVVDVADDFKKEVIDYFIRELKSNRTPNPCVICNRRLKFEALFRKADELGIDHVATGHYARKGPDPVTGDTLLRIARDRAKDQTYSLSYLPSEWIERIEFPLGDLLKQEVCDMAGERGFEWFAKRKQSQDFCFVSGNCMKRFLEQEIGIDEGPIVDMRGRELGRHHGLHFYTIGQRRGIELAGGPHYVVGTDDRTNALVVSKDENDLGRTQAMLNPCHLTSSRKIESGMPVKAKIRSHHAMAEARFYPQGEGKMQIEFSMKQPAITPGQFAVLYEGDLCLGEGRIQEVK